MTFEASSKSLSQQRFDHFAPGYVTSKTHAKAEELDRLVEISQPKPEWAVLDVATGGGHTALRFAPHVESVVATDIAPRMLRKAQAFVARQGVRNVTFRPADAEQLPFASETFDLVTCRIAPHHFPAPARFVRESARVLKAGGLLLVQDHVLPEEVETARYIDDFERLRDPSHNRACSATEWVSMLREAGLQVKHVEQIVKRHVLLTWAERQGCTTETVERLKRLIATAPGGVVDWLQPRDLGTPEASFANLHIIILGRKGAST
jgi:ubiquinone/menaquinone biosynthesis C-methylase UbiE